MNALIGKKVGITQLFDEEGKIVPVTIIETKPNVITAIRTIEKDGYNAVQLGYGEMKKNSRRGKRISKSLEGVYKKNKLKVSELIKEIRVDDVSSYSVGQEFDCTLFEGLKYLDVQGTTIGKGFQGVIRRYGMRGGPGGHGSGFHRRPGAIGNCSDPSRVFKGKKMPGRMGGENRTVKNLRIVGIDKDNNCILVKGSVPGNKKNYIFVSRSEKNK